MTHTLDTILGQVALSLSILGFALAGIIPVGISANRQFMDEVLGIDRTKNTINGFNFVVPLVESSAYNSYLENVSNKTDTLYLRIEESLISMMKYAYLKYIEGISKKFRLKEKEVILAFDYTEEDFYGNVQGLDIHG